MANKEPPQTRNQTCDPTPAQAAKSAHAARKQARLSQALKANMARRKGQARARAGQTDESAQTSTAETDTPQTRTAQDTQHKET
ncbi:hypothetical protein [Sulfitobacter guttiformis]|uniref:Uncharacterized protein n=1 Tax=Sulfitobacter guttiformis TaxID=74349 RepID=A0A420DTM4_9RHOB|nr:hypothetical protein [Sulfitobacter guttiformis]KIN71161.1 hypothetical protein Z949_319 [Sulfitobacter guttiformis KCTC 32187]RKE97636.1 hypothetical protein C8N30_2254 [Sulfitobacter guttiformis]